MTPNHNDLMNERRKHAGDVPTQTKLSNVSVIFQNLRGAEGARERNLKRSLKKNYDGLSRVAYREAKGS